MTIHFEIAAILTAGLLSGCASTVYEGRLAWEDGWREGSVVAVGDGASFVEKLAENCRQQPAATTPSARYATIRYRRDRRPAWRTVPIPDDSGLNVNDSVYVNFVDCKSSVAIRGHDR